MEVGCATNRGHGIVSSTSSDPQLTYYRTAKLYSLTPYDADEPVEVTLKKTKDFDVELSSCNPVSE